MWRACIWRGSEPRPCAWVICFGSRRSRCMRWRTRTPRWTSSPRWFAMKFDATKGFPGEGPLFNDKFEWDLDAVLGFEDPVLAASDAQAADEECVLAGGPVPLEVEDEIPVPTELEDLSEAAAQRAGLAWHPNSQPTSKDATWRRTFQLTIETVNGGSWAAAKTRIVEVGEDVHVFVLQETRLAPDRVAEADRWLAARGWMAVWEPAQRLPSGRFSGGVAIVVRSFLGLAEPAVGAVNGAVCSVPGHFVVGQVGLPGDRDVLVGAIYLHDSEGLSEANCSIIDVVAELAAQASCPCIFGGDWNMEGNLLTERFMELDCALQVVPGQGQVPSCVPRGGMHRTLDFFVGDASAVQLFEPPVVMIDAVCYPHRPVRVQMRPGAISMQTPQWRRPTPMPRAAVVGPWRQTRSTTRAWRAAIDARIAAVRGGSRRETQRALTRAYFEWALVAEDEVAAATDFELRGSSLRARAPRMVMTPVCPPRSEESVAERSLRAQLWLGQQADFVLDLIGAGASLTDGQYAADLLLQRGRDIVQGWLNGWRLSDADENRTVVVHGFAWCSWVAAVLEASSDLEGADSLPVLASRWCASPAAAFFASSSARLRQARDSGWRAWATTAVSGGARGAHRFTRVPEARVLRTVKGPDNEDTAASVAVAESYGHKFAELWAATAIHGGRVQRQAPLDELPRLRAGDLRCASMGYPPTTSIGVDGFAMQHFGMMSDDTLDILGHIFAAMEASGEVPNQWEVLNMSLIPKATGGHRTIGIFVGAVRLWAKARRGVCDEWEKRHDRPYWGAAKGKAPLDPVWRWATQAEAAPSDSQVAVALVDVAAFYESIDWDILWEEAGALGFPLSVLRVALTLYGMPRYVRLGPYSAQPRVATRGVVAGCSLATTVVKIYLLRRLDAWVGRHPAVELNAFIDDMAVAASGAEHAIPTIVATATVDLEEVLNLCGCMLSDAKTQVVASRRCVANRIGRILGLDAQQSGVDASFLGADFAPRIARWRWQARSRRRKRLLKVRRCAARLRRLRAAAGPRATLVAAAGLAPQGGYGAEITGLSDPELLGLRRALAAGAGPKAAGRSLAAALLLEGDAAWSFSVAPVVRWAAEVWRAGVGAVGGLALPVLRQRWSLVSASWPSSWRHVKGPLGAAHLSLKRLGWCWVDAFRIMTDEGILLSFIEHSPKAIRDALRHAVRRGLERDLLKHLCKRGEWVGLDGGPLKSRICVGSVLKTVRSRKHPLEPLQRGCLLSVAAGALWTRTRLRDAGYHVCPMCPKCGKAEDTEHHRWWMCSHPDAQQVRDRHATPALQHRARRAGAHSLVYSRALVEHPVSFCAPPASKPLEQMRVRSPSGSWAPHEVQSGVPADLQGNEVSIFVDGSCTTHDLAERRRAAWAVVWTSEVGQSLAEFSGLVPAAWPQTPQAAEYLAGQAAALVAKPGQSVYSDCQNVVRHFNQPNSRAALSDRLRYSGVVRGAMGGGGWEAARRMQKVAAHVTVTADLTPRERFLARGNDAADVAAKAAVGRHPAADAADWEQAWADACSTAQLIAALGPLWPRARPQGGKKLTRSPAPTADAAAQRLQVEEAQVDNEEQKESAEHAGGRMRGIRRVLDGPAAPTHKFMCAFVIRSGDDSSPFLICMQCGCWMEAGVSRGLLQNCKRCFSSKHAESAVHRVRRGLFPKPGASGRGGLVDQLRPVS